MKEIWLFGATKFQGNPKFLFLYVNRANPEISAYWIADTEAQADYINNLGYQAVLMGSEASDKLFEIASVYVVENFRESLPATINPKIKIANLWHGVGLKHVEYGLDQSSPLTDSIVRKNVRNGVMYRNNLAFLATSQFMQDHFAEEMHLDLPQFIQGAYPRNVIASDDRFATFDHSNFSNRQLDNYNGVVLYAPTYRDSAERISLFTLFEDVERLKTYLTESNSLFIFKMHHFEEKNPDYLEFKKQHSTFKNFLFWEDKYDIYEIFNRITTGIGDYSSIFYDLLQAGVPNHIRYVPDLEVYNQTRGIKYDYLTNSGGTMAYNFDQLMNALESGSNPVENKQYLLDTFFGFDDQNLSASEKMDSLVEKIRHFQVQDKQYNNLYSFDVFDTLIRRSTVEPMSVFLAIQERMKESNLGFSQYMLDNYPKIRHDIEFDLRDVYRKTTFERDTDHIEITFDALMDRLADNLCLTNEQAEFLKRVEIEEELKAVRPIQSRIDQLFAYQAAGHDVILVSDMYLPKEVVQQMAAKADPRLADIPLYISSEVGDQKSTGKLYKHIFFDRNRIYGEWVHFGDNAHADHGASRRFGIKPRHHQMNCYSPYEKSIINFVKNHDGYKIAGLINQKRWDVLNQNEMTYDKTAYYAYAYVGAFYVPYILWSIKDAIARGYETLYFISRDGYYLKAIADEIIKQRGYNIKTRFIYGSRKAWRLAAQIDHIDDEFFQPFGLFTVINSYDEVIRASQLSEEELVELVPQIKNFKFSGSFKGDVIKEIRYLLQSSEAYRNRLLEIGAKQRELVVEYLAQEIDFSEKFSFVEYWGRGYTQDLLARLLQYTSKSDVQTPCYYIRNYTGNMNGSIRHRYLQAPINYTFVEAVFATTPYKSIPGYVKAEDGRVEAIVEPQENPFHAAISEQIVKFAQDFLALDLRDEDGSSRLFAEHSFRYQLRNPLDAFVLDVYSSFSDNVNSFGDVTEICPPFTAEMLKNNTVEKLKGLTANLDSSIVKSSPAVQKAFLEKCKKESVDYKEIPTRQNPFPINPIGNYVALHQLPAKVYLRKNNAVYNSINFTDANKEGFFLNGNQVIDVLDIVWMTGGAVPRLLTPFGYITAHKDFIRPVTEEDDLELSNQITFSRKTYDVLNVKKGERILALSDIFLYNDKALNKDSFVEVLHRGDTLLVEEVCNKSVLKTNKGYIRAYKDNIAIQAIAAYLLSKLNGQNIVLLKDAKVFNDKDLKKARQSVIKAHTYLKSIKPIIHNKRLILGIDGGFIELKEDNASISRKDISQYFVDIPEKGYIADSALKIYTDIEFTQPSGEYIKKNRVFKPEGLAWTEKGTPRFKIEGGFVTTNKKFVRVASTKDLKKGFVGKLKGLFK